MELISLANPNVSSSKFKAESLSFALDNRGFPHISWAENRNGQFGISYRFWDGLEWGYYGDTPLIDSSYEDIIHSDRSLIFDNTEPLVIYGRKEEDYKVCVASLYDAKWNIEKITIGKEIHWIGANIVNRVEEYSSSSSTSHSFSESSDSNSLSSPSSMSFSFSSSSSSSSSFMDVNILISLVDENNDLNVYTYSLYTNELTWLSSSNITTLGIIKNSVCGKYLGFVNEYGGKIYFNFYDVFSNTWAFDDWQEISACNNPISFDIFGTNVEDAGVLNVGWTEINGLKLASVYSTGEQEPFYSSYTVETFTETLTSSTFNCNTKGNVALTWNPFNRYVLILLGGTQNTLYGVRTNTFWKRPLDVVGQPLKYNPSHLNLSFDNISGKIHYSFIAQSDVYHFLGNIDNSPIHYNASELTILNSQRYKYGLFHPDENIVDFWEQACAWDNRTGDMLLETVKRVVVMADENADPICNTSSSSFSEITETLDTSMTDIDEEICNIKTYFSGNEGYYKEFIIDPPYTGNCSLCYQFKTYVVKDRLTITFYDKFNSVLAEIDTGCIATYSSKGPLGSGWKTGCIAIPLETAKVTVQVIPDCEPVLRKTAWILITSCVCYGSTSSSSSQSPSSDSSPSSPSSPSSLGITSTSSSSSSYSPTSTSSELQNSTSSPTSPTSTSSELQNSTSSLTSTSSELQNSTSSPTSLGITSTSSPGDDPWPWHEGMTKSSSSHLYWHNEHLPVPPH